VAESSFAEVHVEDVGGPVALKCQNGKINAVRVAGAVTAANSYAALRVDDVRGDAILDRKTARSPRTA